MKVSDLERENKIMRVDLSTVPKGMLIDDFIASIKTLEISEINKMYPDLEYSIINVN